MGDCVGARVGSMLPVGDLVSSSWMGVRVVGLLEGGGVCFGSLVFLCDLLLLL